MPSEWFYTTNKVQMGPVSWDVLRELASVGILKPHDLVWSEGMEEWIKAINQKGLFTDSADVETSSVKKSSYAEPKPPPGRRRPREDDEDDEEDEQEEKRKTRKKKQQNTHMAVGIKVGLILASVLALLMLLGCVIGALIYFSTRGGGGGGGGGLTNQTYTIFNLGPNRMEERRFNFHQGRNVVITATNNLTFPNTDVDLRIFQGNNPNPFVWDDRLPHEDRNCRVEFIVPANDSYRIRIVNLGPGNANSSVVTINER